MLAFALIILSSVMNLVEGTLIKRYNGKHTKGGFIFTAMVSLFSMLFFLLTDTGGLDFRAEMIPYGIVSGIFYFSASFLTFVALGCGPFALSMLIISYSCVFSIAYGIFFLKDEISIFTVMGIILIFVSLFLNRSEKKAEEKKASLKWLICIGVSFFGNGMLGVLQKMQQIKFNNEITNEYMVVTLSFSALTLFIIGFIKDRKYVGYIFRYGSIYSSVAGISNGATNFLLLTVNTLLPLSIVAPVSAGTKIVLAFIMSVAIFKEKFLKRQVAGVIVGAIALILLNI